MLLFTNASFFFHFLILSLYVWPPLTALFFRALLCCSSSASLLSRELDMVASSHSLSYSQTKFFAYILLIYTSTMSSHSTTKFLPQSSFFYFFSKQVQFRKGYLFWSFQVCCWFFCLPSYTERVTRNTVHGDSLYTFQLLGRLPQLMNNPSI